MIQVINITDARNNLAKLVQKIKETKEPVILVQDSSPAIVLYPYDEAIAYEKEKNELFQTKFSELLKEGKTLGKQFLKKKKISQPLSEEDTYNLVKNG